MQTFKDVFILFNVPLTTKVSAVVSLVSVLLSHGLGSHCYVCDNS